MAFNSNDLYTVSGGVDIFNYWNPFVTKHDSSSFYNWEQDNLPLYDLEERTYYLWEKFGYPLSGVPSMALLVSSTIPTHLVASANVFTSVSAAIESLPEIIRMPTLIEVAMSGHLGTMELNNIKCEEDGALEIINRGFAPLLDYEEVSGAGSLGNKNLSIYNNAQHDSSRYIPNIYSGLGPIDYITNSSAIAFSANTSDLFNLGTDPCFFRTLAMPIGYTNDRLSTGAAKSAYSIAGVGNDKQFRTSNYIYVAPIVGPNGFGGGGTPGATDSTITTLDLSTPKPGGSFAYRSISPVHEKQLLNGIVTANRISKIKLENCDGPIYVRGFIVDGYDDIASVYETTTGIGVYNSTNVSIIDCGAMRCTEAGYEINNSKVNLSRRNVACRNYDTTQRGADTYSTYGFKVINSDVKYDVTNSYSVGIAALFASHFHTYGLYLNNSTFHGGDLGPSMSGGSIIDVNNARDITPLEIGYNDYGIYCDNSKYDIKGCTDVYNCNTNIKAIGSEVRTGKFIVDNAVEEGLDFSESRYILNTDFNPSLRSTAVQIWNSSDPYRAQLLGLMSNNRRHVKLDNGSYYGPDYPKNLSGYQDDTQDDVFALANVYNRIVFANAFGRNDIDSPSQNPPITLNNSKAEMPATVITQDATLGVNKGAAISVNDQSVCKFIGFRNNSADFGATIMEGAGTTDSAAIVANNNSTVIITGPTAIYQFGVGLLAENNSLIRACPVLDVDNLSYDGSGWGRMTNDVGTALEIHSLRAGAVANKGSKLSFEDLGNYLRYWPNSTTSASDYHPVNSSASALSSIHGAGALQFYPNPPDSDIAIAALGSTNFRTLDLTAAYTVDYDSTLSCLRLLYKGGGGYADADIQSEFREGATRGGVCVVATGDSEVFLRNVHFPTGQYNADRDFYDPSASVAGCNDLFIWNVQDTSRINASYATVSGLYPSLAGYTGPRAAYVSEGETYIDDDGNEASAVAYGAFSGTPDTGTLSVLDHFGSGVPLNAANVIQGTVMSSIQTNRTGNTSTYGPNSYENRGPFRLFFPVKPEAKVLRYVRSDVSGDSVDTRPYQHLAQGYALSGEVSAYTELSTVYPSLYTIVNDLTPWVATMSGWYYPESTKVEVLGAVLESSSFTTNALLPEFNSSQVLLDESFANTFNNAKHCNTNYSGRKRLVNIYKASTGYYGEAFPGEVSGYGLGFRSTNLFDFERDI